MALLVALLEGGQGSGTSLLAWGFVNGHFFGNANLRDVQAVKIACCSAEDLVEL